MKVYTHKNGFRHLLNKGLKFIDGSELTVETLENDASGKQPVAIELHTNFFGTYITLADQDWMDHEGITEPIVIENDSDIPATGNDSLGSTEDPFSEERLTRLLKEEALALAIESQEDLDYVRSTVVVNLQTRELDGPASSILPSEFTEPHGFNILAVKGDPATVQNVGGTRNMMAYTMFEGQGFYGVTELKEFVAEAQKAQGGN